MPESTHFGGPKNIGETSIIGAHGLMVLETLLCILLYLGAIVSPGTYTMQQIDDQATANQPAIDQIHSDPVQEQAIVQQFTPQLEFIHINDIYAE